jgi:DNA-binding transcriptional ArsR family regulator
VVDEVVGDPADRPVWGVDPITAFAHSQAAVPEQPGGRDLHAVLDGETVGALIGHPSRARMLDSLMSGRALAAGELARVAGIGRSAASEHLARLLAGGLVEVVAQGRHRYYWLATPEVGTALEALSHVAPPQRVTTLRQSDAARALAFARTCYDHLAGQCGVELPDALLRQGWVSDGYVVTSAGTEALAEWGIDAAAARALRRTFARPCLD